MSSQELSPPFVRRLLNQALKDPRTILDDKKERYRRPEVYLPFFDHCEALAYEEDERALELAGAAEGLAEEIDDRHVVHRALGVRFNAAVALAQWGPAAHWLHQQERAVAGCCPSCQTDHLLRRADFALEYRRLSETLSCLDEADPGSLRKQGEILDAFKNRLADARDWTKVRNHIRWLEAILLARCDAVELAEKRLERVRWQLKEELGLNGPVKPRAPKVPRFAVLVPIPYFLAEKYIGWEEAERRWRQRPTRSATPLCYPAAASPPEPGKAS